MKHSFKVTRSRFPSIEAQALRLLIPLFVVILSIAGLAASQTDSKKDEKKKKKEPFKIQQLTQAMGLYSLGDISPDRQSILLLAQHPGEAPNLYVMKIGDHSIRPPLTSFKLGVSDAQWSPDGTSVALAAATEASSFPEVFTLELRTGKLRRMTSNSFSDREAVYTPDGKRLLYTSDESPLPDAAFGTLHIASVAVSGGKPDAFTEDDVSSIHPGISSDGKSVLLVKVDERSGRHSLFQYGFDGKEQRDLTERKFARIHRYFNSPDGSIILWAQEEPEEQDGVYVFDPKTRETRALPDPDLAKRNPTVSFDGKRIAFISPTDLGPQLFVFDSVSGAITQLTTKPGSTHSPVFVSNNEIMFGSNREKHEQEIFVVDLNQPVAEEKKK